MSIDENDQTAELAMRLSRRLQDYDLTLDPPPWALEQSLPTPATIRRRDTKISVTAVLQSDMTMTSLMNLVRHIDSATPVFVLGARVHTSSADTLRSMGVLYLDAAGNAYIDGRDMLVDVRGRRDDGSTFAASPRLGTVNLFSPKRAQVIFAILSWPSLLRQPLRRIADCAGVSIGAVHETLDRLTSFGFLDEAREDFADDTATLVDGWVGAYPTGLAASTRLREFSGATDRLVDTDGGVYVTVGAEELGMRSTEDLVVYVEELTPLLIGANRWRTDGRRNVTVRRRFWSPPHEHLPRGVQTAPPLLVYADLVMTGDPRLMTSARALRQRSGFPRAR